MDYSEGLKKEVAEVKFLIHDLRVRWFFNEVIHYHVSLNADLEIHGVEQAQVLHGADLDELKNKARDVRRYFHAYSSAVKNFSPDRTVLLAGKRYVQAIFDMCELILNPMWGRIDRVLSFLPPESRSVRSRSHYDNCIHWICGVRYRLDHFLAEEQSGKAIHEEFDVAEELRDFAHNVLFGYVVERSAARVELRLDALDPAVLGGRRHRFRRMFFNLIMNAVDAMRDRKVGVIHVTDTVEGGLVTLRVSDNGSGMPAEKIQQLMADKESLDGELDSLGFVFVRQTVAELDGHLEITSEEGKGTTITIHLPRLLDATPTPRPLSDCEKTEPQRSKEPAPAEPATPEPVTAWPSLPAPEKGVAWGETILEDYRASEAPHPGCIFAIGVTEEDEVDYFTHKPYERLWNITHEDLAPMFFRASVRGRLEEDEEKRPVLILKAPHDVQEYFELKELEEGRRSPETYVRMVRDEYVRIARKLMATGMGGTIGVHLAEAERFFADRPELVEQEPFALETLARQKLAAES
jgi:hypothetical protein